MITLNIQTVRIAKRDGAHHACMLASANRARRGAARRRPKFCGGLPATGQVSPIPPHYRVYGIIMSNYVEWKDDPRREKSIYDDDIYEPSANEPKSRGDVIEKRWAFCPVSGQLLILDAPKGVARSEKVEFSRPLSVSGEPGNAALGGEQPEG